MDEQPRTGYYGKIPSNGDFLVRHLPRRFVDPWDRFLQEGIAASRRQLGDQWLDVYLTSPVWHFALSHGICSPSAWIGILMPSVDNVGRYFPLTLASEIQGDTALLDYIETQSPWYVACEDLALSTLEDHFQLEPFNHSIDALELIADRHNFQRPHSSGGANPNRWRIGINPPGQIRRSLPLLTQELLQARFAQFSLWWTHGSERISPSMLVCRHLPPGNNFAALLDGNWSHWGWEDKYVIVDGEENPYMEDRETTEPPAD